MSADESPSGTGIEMSEQEVEATLRELGHGTLALASGDEAYGVPVSFGFDGERLFLTLLQFGEESRKLAFADHTETATLTAYETASKFDWRSVVVTGELQEVPSDEHEYLESVMDDNAWFPNLFAPTEAITEVRRMELRLADATGRKGVERR
jgi:nitroimidazol reductase NimA-like FMN-containing flavoprotein (pyridoxamine 5'-phosphate oxidase superfamily)